MLSTTNIAQRVHELDWSRIYRDLDERGYALTPRILSEAECEELRSLFSEEDRFRNVIDMRQVRFGSGVYKYFDNPLPEAVEDLREAFYPPLSAVANDWAEKLGQREAYPGTLQEFLEICHEAGQVRPTPLILRYEVGDYNALHQDVYGEVSSLRSGERYALGVIFHDAE
jgi:uncharacterized protein